MEFDEFRLLIENIEAPKERLGIFRVEISNKGREYDFHCLHPTEGYNKDLFGFCLNHYGWLNLPMPAYAKSQFHDCEDVDIDIWRKDFIEATQTEEKKIALKMKNWTAIIHWS